MRRPTDQQQAILDSTARIRVVSASPGSGKTWLIGELIKRSLDKWKVPHRGIATLSFTNTARQEIIDAVGFQPSHPHFVGTLDSFILRYLVRPFGHLFCDGLKNIRVVPAHYAADMAEQQGWFQSTYVGKDGKIRNNSLLVTLSKEPRKVAHVFSSNFLEMRNGEPIFTVKEAFKSEPAQLSAHESRLVLKRKLDVWQKSGRVSHSDCAYIALQLLLGAHGTSISAVLSHRFPAIVVDELQDTGYFLGNLLLLLLRNNSYRAMLVGDPDQAIFEFSGAHPSLFNWFAGLDGAQTYEMSRSDRCPNTICKVANHLSSSGRTIIGNSRQGFAGIGWYEGLGHSEIEQFASLVTSRGGELRILARKNSELLKIRGIDSDDSRTIVGGSRPLEKLRRAVHCLRSGNVSKALALTESVLSRVLLESDHLSELELQQTALRSLAEWRSLKLNLLLQAYSLSESSSVAVWCREIIDLLKKSLADRGWSKTEFPKMRMPILPKDLPSKPLFAASIPSPKSSIEHLTVHGAKGQTHVTSLYFVAHPTKESPCPSATWFDEKSEERRIAFVAATRARSNFILCLPKGTLERLRSSKADFVESFVEVCPLMELLEHLHLDADPTP